MIDTAGQSLAAVGAIVSCGVDWITATAARSGTESSLIEEGKRLVQQEAEYGNDVCMAKWLGYHGFSSGGARYGVRSDSFIVQLSSDCARENWTSVYPFARNVSRLDVQATIELDHAQPALIENTYRQLLASPARRGRPVGYALTIDSKGGATLYLGKRSSDTYMRAYDKGRESDCAPPGKLLRYEVELKRALAMDHALRLSQATSIPAMAAAIVSSQFGRHGVATTGSNTDPGENARAVARTTTNRRLLYIGRVVRPMIERCLDHVSLNVVLEALGISDRVSVVPGITSEPFTQGGVSNGSRRHLPGYDSLDPTRPNV